MKPKYLLSKAKAHIKKGTLVGTSAQKVFSRQPGTKLVNTPPYNLVYDPMVRGKIKGFTKDPRKATVSIAIETTNVCNAKCVFCPREAMTRKTGVMDMDTFRLIIDRIKESGIKVKVIDLNGFGEPLLDPHMAERIGYVKKTLGCGTIFFTNAALLTEKKAEEIINSGLDEMNISFNGVTPEGYEKTMVNLKYDAVEKNIANFMKKRKEMGKTKPYVYMSCIYTEKDFDQQAFADKWKGIVDSIFIMPAEKWGSIESDDIPYESLPYKAREWPCSRLWTAMWISWTGDLHVCCKDYNGSTIMGNLTKRSLMDIWQGEKYKKFRELHKTGEHDKIPICKGCGALVRNSILWWTVK
jgi:radical SAM protein with 4Fe4S-binding SPASM domain